MNIYVAPQNSAPGRHLHQHKNRIAYIIYLITILLHTFIGFQIIFDHKIEM